MLTDPKKSSNKNKLTATLLPYEIFRDFDMPTYLCMEEHSLMLIRTVLADGCCR